MLFIMTNYFTSKHSLYFFWYFYFSRACGLEGLL